MITAQGFPDGYLGCAITAPDGSRVWIAARFDSALASRISRMWKAGMLVEFGRVLGREVDSVVSSGNGHCHALAYDFAYGILASIGTLHPNFETWHWCLAETSGRGLHSWIECDGEAFDTVIMSLDGELSPLIYVQPIAECRRTYEPKGLESRSLLDFGRWLSTPERVPLFRTYPNLSELFSDVKQRGWDTGQLGPERAS